MKNAILIVFTLFAFDVKAQTGDMPPNAEAGKCYLKCMIDSTGKFGDWEEVVCRADITRKLVKKIAKVLKSKGYDVSESADKIDAPFRNILSKFQKENKLPIGNLNIKTLDALKIFY